MAATDLSEQVAWIVKNCTVIKCANFDGSGCNLDKSKYATKPNDYLTCPYYKTWIDDYADHFRTITGVRKSLARHCAKAGWDLCQGEVPAIEAAEEEASLWSQDDGLAMMR